MLNIEALFATVRRDGIQVAEVYGVQRQRMKTDQGNALLDCFSGGGCQCLFWRGFQAASGDFFFPAGYRVTTAGAGGWLLLSSSAAHPDYWVPRLPVLRRLDENGRILQEEGCTIASFESGQDGIRIRLDYRPGQALDAILWRFSPSASSLTAQLRSVDEAERSPTFLWGSHGVYRQPSDLYNQLIHGAVFDLRFSWPRRRRAYSENEAHALHLTLRNKELETGKELYRHLRDQILIATLARQGEDGSWRHGIWVDDMECHYRLHCSAMHMLMDCHDERPDPVLLGALARAARYVADQAATVMGETWFLHDSLEKSDAIEGANPSPAHPCTNPQKTSNNRLVLNTHLDTILALHRYQAMARCGDFDDGIASARRLLRTLLAMRPAEPLYRALFRALYLTLLPFRRASALPAPIRALKRAARNYLVPLLPAVKCRLPRLVMPGGYIDRALTAKGLAHSYHAINLMDLARYRQRFPEDRFVDQVIDGAVEFADHYDLIEYWSEQSGAVYAIGFWIEALYRLCLCDPSRELRQRMATALLVASDKGLGMPPSLGGRNCEIVAVRDQTPRAATIDERLWVINLGTRDRWDVLILNPTDRARSPQLRTATPAGVTWIPGWEPAKPAGEPPALPPRHWVGGSRDGSPRETRQTREPEGAGTTNVAAAARAGSARELPAPPAHRDDTP
jgi:hypothetical protein